MTEDSPIDHLNDQIRDSVEQVNKLLIDDEGSNLRAMTYQIMAHSIGLSLYTTVHQQQQMYILQNAATTAAVKQALKSNPADAVKLAQEAIIGSDLTKTIAQLKNLMDELNETYSDIGRKTKKSAPAKKTTPKASKSK